MLSVRIPNVMVVILLREQRPACGYKSVSYWEVRHQEETYLRVNRHTTSTCIIQGTNQGRRLKIKDRSIGIDGALV